MKKILIMIAMILGCIVVEGQEYEIHGDTIFIKGNLFENHEEGYWTTKKGDELIKNMVDYICIQDNYYDYKIIFRNVRDLKNPNPNKLFEFEVIDYYTVEENIYFVYKRKSIDISFVDANDGCVEVISYNKQGVEVTSQFTTGMEEYKEIHTAKIYGGLIIDGFVVH